MGYMGYSFSRYADRRSREAEAKEQPAIEPLPPGVDPLTALDPETRELVTSLEPAVDPDAQDGTTIGDRIGGALVGAGFGAFFGALMVNWTSRRHRFSGAPAMDMTMTLMAAGAGAVIGGIAGYAKGRNPLARDEHERAASMVSSTKGMPAASSHPAFAGTSGPTMNPISAVIAAASSQPATSWQQSSTSYTGDW